MSECQQICQAECRNMYQIQLECLNQLHNLCQLEYQTRLEATCQIEEYQYICEIECRNNCYIKCQIIDDNSISEFVMRKHVRFFDN